MKVQVMAVAVDGSIGHGWGYPVSDMDDVDETKVVEFVGDWRPMLGLALMGATASAEGEHLVVDIPDESIRRIREL